ncbi:MAG: hypothetical protein ABSF46_33905 [Terriglobia bacterium]|jgi:hypothetical protein
MIAYPIWWFNAPDFVQTEYSATGKWMRSILFAVGWPKRKLWMKHADEIVQRFLDAFDRAKDTRESTHVDWLDRDKARAQDERVEALAYDPERGWLAIEHTLVEPFIGERKRIKGPLGAIFEPLAADASLLVAEHFIVTEVLLQAVPKDVNRQLARSALKA